MTSSEQARAFADKVRQLLAKGSINPQSAVEIVRAAGAVGARWETVEEVIQELARGADGISGTADDLIPPDTLGVLLMMLHSGVVRDLAGWMADVSSRKGWWRCWSW